MRVPAAAVLGLSLGFGVAPAMAQSLGDVGRQLKDQLLPGQNQSQDRDRNAYEQGRRDQEEQSRRQRDSTRGSDDRGNGYSDRGRGDDRNQRGVDQANRDRRNTPRDTTGNYNRDRQRPVDDDQQPRSRY